jgi:hypothetical protein
MDILLEGITRRRNATIKENRVREEKRAKVWTIPERALGCSLIILDFNNGRALSTGESFATKFLRMAERRPGD